MKNHSSQYTCTIPTAKTTGCLSTSQALKWLCEPEVAYSIFSVSKIIGPDILYKKYKYKRSLS